MRNKLFKKDEVVRSRKLSMMNLCILLTVVEYFYWKKNQRQAQNFYRIFVGPILLYSFDLLTPESGNSKTITITTVSIKFGNDYTTGLLRTKGKGNQICSESLEIAKMIIGVLIYASRLLPDIWICKKLHTDCAESRGK